MHLVKYSIKYIALLLLFASCNKSKEQAYEMYEMSEMALLMENLYEDNLIIKNKILKNKNIGKFPINHLNIYTAEYTDETFKDVNFEKYALAYIRADEELFSESNSLSLVNKFNNVINSCIACHQSIACPGPVPRIKKLYIK